MLRQSRDLKSGWEYLRDAESCLDNIVCVWVLKQLVEAGSREQFVDDLCSCFLVTYQKTLFNDVAAELLGRQMHVVPLELRCQFGCGRGDLKLQNKLHYIISATKLKYSNFRKCRTNARKQESESTQATTY